MAGISDGGGGRWGLEVRERPTRRRFAAAYKLRVLQEADACRELGEIGALLRREALYPSHLSAWRKRTDEGLSWI